jgi:endonuclease-3
MPGISIQHRREKIDEFMYLLSKEYGPFEEPRTLPPANELVFTILSQHTSDINSGRAYQNLMKTFETLEQVAEAEVTKIETAIQRGGLAKIKAPRIKSVLNEILDKNESLDLNFLKYLPLEEAIKWLTELKGIGPKSAGIVLNFSLGLPAMAIDTHIYRVSQRLNIIPKSKNVNKAHEFLQRIILPDQITKFHTAIITHGRKTCIAPLPRCNACVLKNLCPSKPGFDSKLKSSSKISAKNVKLTANKKKIIPHSPIPSEENK